MAEDDKNGSQVSPDEEVEPKARVGGEVEPAEAREEPKPEPAEARAGEEVRPEPEPAPEDGAGGEAEPAEPAGAAEEEAEGDAEDEVEEEGEEEAEGGAETGGANVEELDADELEEIGAAVEVEEPEEGESLAPHPPPSRAAPAAPPPPPPVPSAAAGPAEALEVEKRHVIEEAVSKASQEDFAWEREIYSTEISEEKSKPRLALLHHELGEIYERRLGRMGEAGKAYGQAVRLSSAFLANLWAVRRVLFRRGRWANVLKLVNAELKLATDEAHRSDLLVEKAHLLETKLEEIDEAREAYAEAFEVDGGRIEALMALERLYARRGESDDLARVCRLHADAVEDAGRKSAILQVLARILEKNGAGYEERKQVLEQAADSGGLTEPLAWDLERLAMGEGRFEDLFEVLERRAALLEREGRLEEALGVSRQQARLAAIRMRDPDEAWRILSGLRERRPDNPQILADLTLVARRAGRWEALAELLEERLEADDLQAEERRGLELDRSIALLRMGRKEEGLAKLREMEGAQESVTPEVHLFLEREALASSDPERLESVLAGVEESVRTAWQGSEEEIKPFMARSMLTRAHLLIEAAELARSRAAEGEGGDADGERARRLEENGAALCGDAMRLMPELRSAAYLLEEAWTRLGSFDELCSWQREMVEREPSGEEATRLLESLADVYLSRKADPEGAVWALKRLAGNAPDDTVTQMRLAFALQDCGRWGEAAEVIEKVSAGVVDPKRQADLFVLAADLGCHRGSDTEGAIRRLRAAKEAVPDHPVASEMLEDLLMRSERWEEMAESLRQESEQVLDERRLERCLMKLGEVLELRLGRTEEAAAVYEDVLERFPESLSATRALARLWRSAGHKPALADLLERQAASATDEDARADLLSGASRLREVGEETASALDVMSHAFDLRPYDRNLAWSLTRLLTERGDWAKTTDVLERHAEALQERRDDSVVHDGPAEELAWTLEVALGDFGRGWEQWERLVGEDGQVGRRAAWAAARQAVRDGDLLRQSALESRLAEECSQGVDEALLVRAALHRAIGGDDDAEIWKKVASTGSEMARLAALMGGELRGEAAGELLGWAADNSQSREERACWLRARSLCMDSEGRMAEAAESVNALMELAPEDYSVALYGRAVARRLGDARAEAALAVKLGELTSDDEKAAIAFADGAKLLEELSELDEARRVWRQVLACRPGDEEAFRRLGRLLRSEQRWEELVGLLSHRITVRGDEAEEVALYLERSRILESRLGDSTTAAADLHRALALDPEEESALLRLGRMYGRDGNHEKAEELLRSCLEHAEQEQLRLTAVFALAEVLELRDRQEEASRLLETELPSELEPQALERLLSHKLRARQWQQGVNVLDRIGETVESRSDKAIVERRKSRLYRELMANEELSNQCLKKAIELDPRELAPLRALVERYREIGKADSADEMLGRAIGTQLQHIRGELEAEPLRNVAELSALAGETERRFWAISALAVLGQLSPEEKQWYDKRCADAMGSGSEPMEQRVWAEDVMHPDAAQETIFGLWQRLQPAADKIFEADLGEMGVGRGDRVTGGSEGVIGEMLSIAEVIGADIEDVYRWRGHGDELRCVPTSSGPVLLVGDDLATGRSAMSFLGRYRLGCLLGACRASTVALLDRPIEEIEMLFVGGVSEGGQSVGHQLEQARVDAMSKKIKKALSRKQRKALGPAAERFARQPFELERWAGGLARTYQRCGLLVAGRLEPAVADATGTTPEQWDAKPADERLDSIRGHSAAEELIEYSVSQGHIEARAAIGLSRNNE